MEGSLKTVKSKTEIIFLRLKKPSGLPKFRYLFLLLLFLASLLMQIVALKPVLAWNDDYPLYLKNAAQDSITDPWKELNRECTSFAAWRLHDRNGFDMPFNDDAYGWGGDAMARGYAVNMAPAVGAIAWWNWGHVAWVESVGSGVVTIEEYNFGTRGAYGERTIAANSVSGYIHFKDIIASSGSGQGAGIVASFLGTDHLAPGQIMRTGQYILSPNAQYLMVLQGDGNLVLYGNGMKAMWSSNTSGSGASFLGMQDDGNLVLYTSDVRPVWYSSTAGRGSSNFFIQDDGNAVIYTVTGIPTWASNTGGHGTFNYYGSDHLGTDQIIRLNQYIRSSDGRYVVMLQGDGNLVLYGPGYHVLWSAGTGGQPVAFAAMQGDGNLVLYTSNGRPVWYSATAGKGSSFAVIQNDGNFVIYTSSGVPTWYTSTAGKI